MKLVITTQYMENYAVEQGGDYWKCKGGNTLVVENLNDTQVSKIDAYGIPTLKSLIEYTNKASREYVIGFDIVADDAKVADEWETVTKLSWENGRWIAREITENGEYGYMNKKIAVVSKSWDMVAGGKTENLVVEYTLRDGRKVLSEGISEALAA